MSLHPLSASSLFSLKGRVALVTGGGTGIGLIIAEALAANGAKVWIAGRRLDVLQQTAKYYGDGLNSTGGSLVPVQMDHTDKKSIQEAVEAVKAEDGMLNILVNNAGRGGGGAKMTNLGKDIDAFSNDLFNVDAETWSSVNETNVIGPYLVSSAFLPLLTAGNTKFGPLSSSITNISSIMGVLKNGLPGAFPYTTSKAAVLQLTQNLASTFAHKSIGVRVNALCPGWYLSELSTGGNRDRETNKSTMDMSALADHIDRLPAGRPGSANDMAKAILDLVTNEYLIGQAWSLEGGHLRFVP